MSTSHELLRETAALLKQLDVKVKNVEELRGLLDDLPGVTDPEVTAARAMRTVAVTALSVTLGVVGLATLVLAAGMSSFCTRRLTAAQKFGTGC